MKIRDLAWAVCLGGGLASSPMCLSALAQASAYCSATLGNPAITITTSGPGTDANGIRYYEADWTINYSCGSGRLATECGVCALSYTATSSSPNGPFTQSGSPPPVSPTYPNNYACNSTNTAFFTTTVKPVAANT